jgi:hypothetical protein
MSFTKSFGEFPEASSLQPTDIIPLQRGASGSIGASYLRTTLTALADLFAVQWGAITGRLEDQTDLQDALNERVSGDGVAKITASLVEPSNPSVGDMWIDTN